MKKLKGMSIALLLGVPVWAAGQQAAAPGGADTAPQQGEVQQAPGQQTPGGAHRAVAEPPMTGMSGAGRDGIQLNVVVTDKSGTPVAGLNQQEFTVLDNGQPRPILSFHAYTGAVHADGPPVETIILFDRLNMDVEHAGQARVAIDQYLRGNGGHLAGPTSVFLFTEDGLQGETSTTDGNALAAKVDQIAARNRSIPQTAGEWGEQERFNLSLKALGVLIENEGKQPGRKLLIWVGPGSPLLYGEDITIMPKELQRDFMTIVNISKLLREDQITMYSVSIGQPDLHNNLYTDYVKGVKEPKDALPSYLNTKVFAVQSGGLVLGPDNDMARQIGICQRDASAYYTITFAPPRADKRDEYHQIEVDTDKPFLKARTTTGYYDEPQR